MRSSRTASAGSIFSLTSRPVTAASRASGAMTTTDCPSASPATTHSAIDAPSVVSSS